MEKLLNIKEVCNLLNISKKTLQRWDKEGKLKAVRTLGGHRRYREKDINKLFGENNQQEDNRINVIYARVSTVNQKNNLENQIKMLKEYCIRQGIKIDLIYKDIGGGLNYKRPEFLRMIKRVINKEIKTIVVSYKDRLIRFGFDFLKWLFDFFNVKIIVANEQEISEQQEMINDIISIIQHYASKIYGKRSYKKKIKEVLNERL